MKSSHSFVTKMKFK